jgi:hypothetical protein
MPGSREFLQKNREDRLPPTDWAEPPDAGAVDGAHSGFLHGALATEAIVAFALLQSLHLAPLPLFKMRDPRARLCRVQETNDRTPDRN